MDILFPGHTGNTGKQGVAVNNEKGAFRPIYSSTWDDAGFQSFVDTEKLVFFHAFKGLLGCTLSNRSPVVPACVKCNQGFAPDEEYVAALIECVLAGSADGNGVGRHNV